MSQQRNGRVFISAVTSELGAHREEVARDLERAGIDVREQGRNFLQGVGTLLENLRGYIAECDTVICLIGNRAGFPPTTEEIGSLAEQPFYLQCLRDTGLTELSRTQWEFLLARHFGRRTLTWMTPEGVGVSSDPSQIAFRRWVESLGQHRETLTDVYTLTKSVLSHFVTPTSARPREPLLQLRAVVASQDVV